MTGDCCVWKFLRRSVSLCRRRKSSSRPHGRLRLWRRLKCGRKTLYAFSEWFKSLFSSVKWGLIVLCTASAKKDHVIPLRDLRSGIICGAARTSTEGTLFFLLFSFFLCVLRLNIVERHSKDIWHFDPSILIEIVDFGMCPDHISLHQAHFIDF